MLKHYRAVLLRALNTFSDNCYKSICTIATDYYWLSSEYNKNIYITTYCILPHSLPCSWWWPHSWHVFKLVFGTNGFQTYSGHPNFRFNLFSTVLLNFGTASKNPSPIKSWMEKALGVGFGCWLTETANASSGNEEINV